MFYWCKCIAFRVYSGRSLERSFGGRTSLSRLWVRRGQYRCQRCGMGQSFEPGGRMTISRSSIFWPSWWAILYSKMVIFVQENEQKTRIVSSFGILRCWTICFENLFSGMENVYIKTVEGVIISFRQIGVQSLTSNLTISAIFWQFLAKLSIFDDKWPKLA